jgi:hypothetical protein
MAVSSLFTGFSFYRKRMGGRKSMAAALSLGFLESTSVLLDFEAWLKIRT